MKQDDFYGKKEANNTISLGQKKQNWAWFVICVAKYGDGGKDGICWERKSGDNLNRI